MQIIEIILRENSVLPIKAEDGREGLLDVNPLSGIRNYRAAEER